MKATYVESEDDVLAPIEAKEKSIQLCPHHKIIKENKTIHPPNLKWESLELSLMGSFC